MFITALITTGLPNCIRIASIVPYVHHCLMAGRVGINYFVIQLEGERSTWELDISSLTTIKNKIDNSFWREVINAWIEYKKSENQTITS